MSEVWSEVSSGGLQWRHLFIDLDGTLTDPAPGITRCIQHALQGLSAPVPEADELLWCIGPPLRESFVAMPGVGEALADRAVALYRERFADVGLLENEAFAGIHDVLEHLASSRTLFVASSKPLVYVRRILEAFDLRRYFHDVFGAELDGTRSDKRELLAHALRMTGAAPEDAMMIGDREHDVIGGHSQGMHTAGVLYGYGSETELRRAGAHRLVARVSDLVRLGDPA